LWEIISARKKKPFESFEDLQNRVSMLPDPRKMIVKRIIKELEGADRHRLFVAAQT
jgi:putative nucleotide binding protein